MGLKCYDDHDKERENSKRGKEDRPIPLHPRLPRSMNSRRFAAISAEVLLEVVVLVVVDLKVAGMDRIVATGGGGGCGDGSGLGKRKSALGG